MVVVVVVAVLGVLGEVIAMCKGEKRLCLGKGLFFFWCFLESSNSMEHSVTLPFLSFFLGRVADNHGMVMAFEGDGWGIDGGL